MTTQEVQVTSNLVIDINEMTAFIKEAKRNSYASGKAKYDPVLKCKYFEYFTPHWYYRDEYSGSFMAPGREIVKYSNNFAPYNPEYYTTVWQMGYAGGIIPRFWQEEKIANLTYDILKLALQNPGNDLPVRGPGEVIFHDNLGDLGKYTSNILGESSILLFSGYEMIQLENKYLSKMFIDWPNEGTTKTFFQHFNGSIIVYDHNKV